LPQIPDLDEPNVADSVVTAASLDDTSPAEKLADLADDVPLMPAIQEINTTSPEESKLAPNFDALDFDLSGLAPETNGTVAAPIADATAIAETEALIDDESDEDNSNNAEMATKLDLAVAYQEIGDK